MRGKEISSIKIVFLSTMLPGYQVEFFSDLRIIFKDLKVISTRETPKIRLQQHWSDSLEDDMTSFISVHPEIKFKIFKWNFSIPLSPKSIYELIFSHYDVVVVGGYHSITSWVSLFICKLRRKKIILRFGTHQKSVSKTGLIVTTLRRFFLSSSDLIMAYGKASKLYAQNLVGKKVPIFIEGNTVNVDRLVGISNSMHGQCPTLRSELSLEQDTLVFLFVGQMIERKNLKRLLYAYSIFNDLFENSALIVIGPGDFETLSSGLDMENVKYIGPVTQETLFKFYTLSDVLCLPSTEEVYGLVVNEAMSFGLPIVASSTCGVVDDLVDWENGVLIKTPFSVDSILASLINIELRSEDMRNMSRSSIQKIKKQNLKSAVNAYQNAIKYLFDVKSQFD